MELSDLRLLLLAFALLIVYRIYKDPLKDFPGPYLAKWTDLWRVLDTTYGMHKPPSHIALHEEHGDIVRTGPNSLIFSNPQAIRDIYGTDKHFPKSRFYSVVAANTRGVITPSLFSSLDVQWHDNLKRAVNPAFTLSALVQYEPFVSRTIQEFIAQLSTRFADTPGPGGVFPLQSWMHWYAFDVVGELTYGSAFGCLRTATDIDDVLTKTHKILNWQMCVGFMPIIDDLIVKNPVLLWLNRRGYFNAKPTPNVKWAMQHQAARLEKPPQEGPQDLIGKFMQAKEKNPDVVSDREVLGMGLSMVNAGSESTAVALTAVFYFLMKNPQTYRKLQKEVDEAFKSEEVSFKEAFALPYLDACIKESFRLHPASRMTLERVLPPEGATISGQFIPGGTVVGMNAWSVHRRSDVFGEDLESYVPERWLPDDAKTDEEEKARIDTMSRTLFHFGAGKFGCIGKNISLMEMYKAVPSLLRAFEFSLDDPAKEWRLENGTFVNVSGVDVRVTKR